MTEQESNCDCNAINFGEFKREDIDKIMINGGYEKDPKENEWIYKPKDANTKKKLYLPKNKGRLEKEKDDIINNIKNKGLNPNARDFVPKSKEKSNNTYVNQTAGTPVLIPVSYNNYNNYFYYTQMQPQFIQPSYRPGMYYQIGVATRNFAYEPYTTQEGMVPPNRMNFDMENPQANGHVSYIPMPMTSTQFMPNMQGGKLNDNKNVTQVNEEYMDGESNGNNLENAKNQDVIIDIETSNEDVTENQTNNEVNEIVQDEKKEKENQMEIKKPNDTTNKVDEQLQKKKKNNKDKSNLEEMTKNKAINDNQKQKASEVKKNNQKEIKETNKNSYASKVENGTNNKKKSNDKKKNTSPKTTYNKDSKINDTNKESEIIKEEVKDENIVKETDKEIKTEETTTNVTEIEKKEEKKEEIKKEETKPRSWASLFSNESSKSNVPKAKTNKANGKVATVKTIPKNQTNIAEPVNLNDKIKISFDPVIIQPRGLINNGNMCFMNAILQPLLYCAPFYNFLISLKKETIQSMNNKPSIIESMIMFINEFKTVKKKDLDSEEYGESFLPEYVYDTLRKFNSSNSLKGRQEDAEEYLGFLLNGIHDEFVSKYTGMTNSNKKSDTEGWMEVGKKNKTVVTREAEVKESPINRIFGGKIKSILKAGNKQSATYEPFLSLQLDITPNNVYAIEDALDNLTIEETVPDYIVNGVKVSAKKQNLIDGLPNVLLLHLKCFTFDHNTTQKVQKKIEFKPVLEIKQELVSPNLKNRAPYKYNLFAVVNHHGKMAGGGHYTCAVKLCNNRWLNFDDTKIQQTSETEVTTPNKNQLPYLLLYTLDSSEQKK